MKGRCDVCGKMKEEWETHNYNSGLTRCKEDCSEKELYPNCSEVTWRLNVTSGLTEKEQIVNALMDTKEYTEEHETQDSDECCLGDMVALLTQAKKEGLDINKISLDIVDNTGGSETYVNETFELAVRVSNDEITFEQAEKINEENDGY